MNLTQTHLSKLKACRRLAGDKAESRRPRLVSLLISALKGRWNAFTISSAPSGRDILWHIFLGYHPLMRVQPQANFRQPFRLHQQALARR